MNPSEIKSPMCTKGQINDNRNSFINNKEEKRGDGLLADKYVQLKVAVQDLLCELRISPKALEIMAKGYAPNYPRAPGRIDIGKPRDFHFKNVVQISQIVAQKIIDAGVIKKI